MILSETYTIDCRLYPKCSLKGPQTVSKFKKSLEHSTSSIVSILSVSKENNMELVSPFEPILYHLVKVIESIKQLLQIVETNNEVGPVICFLESGGSLNLARAFDLKVINLSIVKHKIDPVE